MRGSGGLREDGQDYLRPEQGLRQVVATPRLNRKVVWEVITVAGVCIWGTNMP
jgi:hypothetical protein